MTTRTRRRLIAGVFVAFTLTAVCTVVAAVMADGAQGGFTAAAVLLGVSGLGALIAVAP